MDYDQQLTNETFIESCKSNNLDLFNFHLSYGYNGLEVIDRTFTALDIACWYGHDQIVSLILQNQLLASFHRRQNG